VAEAVAQAHQLQPDVIVMDVRLPDGTGVEACREIRGERPATKVIMLTSYADDEASTALSWPGLQATCSTDARHESGGSHRAGCRRRVPAGPGRHRQGPHRACGSWRPGNDELASLSPQERRIIGLIAEGKTNKEIAEEVFLSRQDGQELRIEHLEQAQPPQTVGGGGIHRREAGKDQRRAVGSKPATAISRGEAAYPELRTHDQEEGLGLVRRAVRHSLYTFRAASKNSTYRTARNSRRVSGSGGRSRPEWNKRGALSPGDLPSGRDPQIR